MIGKNQRISEEIKEEVRKHLETNENKHTSFQNLWDAAKVIQTGKFIAIQSYLRKQEKFQINNLTLPLKKPEEQAKPKVNRRN